MLLIGRKFDSSIISDYTLTMRADDLVDVEIELEGKPVFFRCQLPLDNDMMEYIYYGKAELFLRLLDQRKEANALASHE